MDRKEFFKSFCALGCCSCAAIPLLSAKGKERSSENKEVQELQRKLTFVQQRFGKLIKILTGEMDKEGLNKVLYDMGVECSKEYEKYFSKYKNNLEGFLQMSEKDWGMKIEHNKKQKEIKVFGKKTGKCFCPFVKESLTPADFCNCSYGWQSHTFESVIGKPVKVKIIESVLRGGKSCSFAINYS